MNKKLNKSLRILCIIALWVVLIVASFKAYDLYQYNKLHPQKQYEWNSIGGPPQEFIIKKDMMQSTRRTIILGVLFAMMWEVLLYFDDPKKHFVTYLINKVEPFMDKVSDKFEDDDDENEDK